MGQHCVLVLWGVTLPVPQYEIVIALESGQGRIHPASTDGCGPLLAYHFGNHENCQGTHQTTSAEKVDQGIPSRREHGDDY